MMAIRTHGARPRRPVVNKSMFLSEPGDTSGNTDFWAAADGDDRWASIHFTEFEDAK
jgi:hypothetical protein